jgi:hypothetical protein
LAAWRVRTRHTKGFSDMLGELKSPRKRAEAKRFGIKISKGTWDPIFTEEVSQSIRSILMDPGRKSTRGGKHLLSGLAVCGKCGETLMTSYAADEKRTYACIRNVGTPRCGGTSIIAEPLDELILATAVRSLQGLLTGSSIPKKKGANAKINKAKKELKEKMKIKEGVLELHRQAIFGTSAESEVPFHAETLRMLNETILRLQSITQMGQGDQYAAARKQISENPSLLTQMIKTWFQNPRDVGVTESLRGVLLAIFEEVKVVSISREPGRRKANVIDPRRVQVLLRTG